MGTQFDNGQTKSDSKSATTNQLEENSGHSVSHNEIYKEKEDINNIIPAEECAPDGGWGYMVALGMIVVFITTIGPAPSYTIIFRDFLESTGQAGSAVTVLNSISTISFSCAGLMTNILIKKFSIRSVGVAGAFFYSVPNALTALVRYFYEMAAACLLQGVGLGLMFTICNTNFNAFFVKKRNMVMAVSQAIIGIGWIIYPMFIDQMMKIYGYRGTAAINGALSLNCIVGMTMMHPVEWYLKLPKKDLQLKKNEVELEELITKPEKDSAISCRYTSNNSCTQTNNESFLSSLIDTSLLKKRNFVNSCLGVSSVTVSDCTFSSLLPLMMANRGYTQSDAAYAITVSAITELISRILLAAIMAFVEMRPKKIYFFAMICLTLAKLGYLYFENTLLGVLLMMGAIGVIRSWMCITSLVVVDGINRIDQFASAHGLFAIISGIISIVFGPIVGIIKDWTDSYTLCQYLLIVLNFIFVIPWTIDFISEHAARTKLNN